ncbi:venom protease-like isoform X2 [Teleopsis dalmanni]|uniref:venom protease-like isoform X2 n=1 Tax=Teleopsis dalmanni TaxID=139649 RepID=UPI0018CE468A|nr:venom protease-like isoform X2 [Teleopsis dalmanni]
MKLHINILCYAFIGLAWITPIFSQRFNQRPGRPITQAPITQAPITQPPTTTTTTTPQPITSAPLIEPKGTYCRGPDIREGSCIDLKNCQELVNELYAKQNDQTFANFLRASNRICGATGSIVCCPTGTSQQLTTTPTPRVNSNEIPTRLPTVTEGCGYTASSYKKIVGGEVSKKGAWPWIALLGYNDELSSSPFKCGGTLITARHVITAAHCIRSDLSFVRLGEHDLSTDTETKHVDIPIVKQVVNTDYNKRNGHSDIALLYLERNVEFNDFISPICLPNTPELRQKSYVSSTPFVAGWGKTMEGGISAKILQELQIPIYKNDVCRQSYANEKRLFTENQFDTAVICAGVLSGGKDTCQGDSGGPLMIPEPYQGNVRYYLIGIVSYGIGCARPNIPGVYTSTQYFMDWINGMVANTP